MFRAIAVLIVGTLLSFAATAGEGLIKMKSPYSVKETANRVEYIVSKKGLRLFARVDHAKNATGVHMKLRPTELLIFGNPKVGTPLMQCAQTVAIDLPQKMLVMKDARGAVWVAYNDPNYLKARHHIKECDQVIKKVSGVLSSIASAAVSK